MISHSSVSLPEGTSSTAPTLCGLQNTHLFLPFQTLTFDAGRLRSSICRAIASQRKLGFLLMTTFVRKLETNNLQLGVTNFRQTVFNHQCFIICSILVHDFQSITHTFP